MDETKVVKVGTCQDCKGHKNKPSRCITYKKYVGRKEKICDDFKKK